MSDLKYKSPAELREIISRGDAYRDRLQAEAAYLDTLANSMQKEVDSLREEAAGKRLKAHGNYQRTVWAKTYLARKETGQCK